MDLNKGLNKLVQAAFNCAPISYAPSMSHAIGDIIDIYCTRCRLNLDGSIAALKDGTIKKVTCRTCWNEVPYRKPVDFKARNQKRLDNLLKRKEKQRKEAAAPSADAPDALRALWDELTDKVDARYAKVYDATRAYQTEDALLHKQLGMGIVHNVDQDGEMNVLFRTGFHRIPSQQEPEDD